MLKIFLGAYGSNVVQFGNNEGFTEQTYLQKMYHKVAKMTQHW
jgi:hypothetical protein